MSDVTTTTPPVDRASRRRRMGLGFFAAALAGTVALAWVPAPYVVEMPGPVYDTLGEVTNNAGTQMPMISISGATTYDTTGSLSMLTVWVSGSPESRQSWLDIATAWVRPDYAVLPMDALYPPGFTHDDSVKSAALQMSNSKQEAIAAALNHLNIAYRSQVAVASVMKGYPAAGVLQPDDVVLRANGVTVRDVSGLRAEIKKIGSGGTIALDIVRAGKPMTVTVGIKDSTTSPAVPVVGVETKGEYTFPFPIDIQLDNVGGSSAGMMFALGIIDELTPGSLTGGAKVAGTGEIAADGTVGEIGGIVQKAYAARDAGATWILVPAANCAALAENMPVGIRAVRVNTLDDSLAALHAISTHSGTTALPSCSAG